MRARALFTSSEEMGNVELFNGLFSVTPDGLPLAGSVGCVEGLWISSAVWITHAAGVARVVSNMLAGREVDTSTERAMSPDRLLGQDQKSLTQMALRTYNNIYNTADV